VVGYASVDLPAGLASRPLALDDAHAVFELIAAQEATDLDEVMIEEADIVGDWSQPSFDVAASTIGVFDGEQLVAYGEVGREGRCDAAVRPDHRGRGIGTAVARWMQDHARARGIAEIGMPVPQGSAGDRLLDALGYRVRWESWGLSLLDGATVPERELPEGYVVREADPSEYEQVWEVQEDAFLEWSDRDRSSYEDFEAAVVGRPGFEPWNLRVAVGPDGAVVGVSVVIVSDNGSTGFVDRLAVRRDQRNRGIAQALLVDSFARAREHGTTTAELSTDSRTGALPLYERVGMVAESVWVNRALDLTPTTENAL
jgi:mycothiol synthase